MKPSVQMQTRAFTLVEVLVVVVCLVLVAAFVLPTFTGISRPKAKSQRITCVNNLKMLGLGMRVFANDHDGNWPMTLALTNGGTWEHLNDPAQMWRHWLAVSNEISTPKILVCPSDKQRNAASHFAPSTNNPAQLVFSGNQHVSYFLGLNSTEEEPQSILAGDRNVTTNGIPLGPGRHVIAAGTRLGFTAETHGHAGNILLGDGGVQQVRDGRFNELFADALKSTALTTNVWLVP